MRQLTKNEIKDGCIFAVIMLVIVTIVIPAVILLTI